MAFTLETNVTSIWMFSLVNQPISVSYELINQITNHLFSNLHIRQLISLTHTLIPASDKSDEDSF